MLGFESRVATRFLREGRMQTVLIIVGVAAGVAVIAYISALITGLQSNTLEKTLGAQAHVSLNAPDDIVAASSVPALPVASFLRRRLTKSASVRKGPRVLTSLTISSARRVSSLSLSSR